MLLRVWRFELELQNEYLDFVMFMDRHSLKSLNCIHSYLHYSSSRRHCHNQVTTEIKTEVSMTCLLMSFLKYIMNDNDIHPGKIPLFKIIVNHFTNYYVQP